jgi:chemotaxis regulatin CheY-phosphate phosphatase CheZ
MSGTVPDVLRRTSEEIAAILSGIRQGREEFEQAAAERIGGTRDKLREVSAATEVAAVDMLNSLDRTVSLLDTLEQPTNEVDARATRQAMRNELGGLFISLQFQDITAQQLAHASRMLDEVERKLLSVIARFDSVVFGIAATHAACQEGPGAGCFDPGASFFNADARQAVADEIFHAGQ